MIKSISVRVCVSKETTYPTSRLANLSLPINERVCSKNQKLLDVYLPSHDAFLLMNNENSTWKKVEIKTDGPVDG